MRVLLDECLPRRLSQEIEGHHVVTVPGMGWAGKANGELLYLMSGQFDVFVMMDQGIAYQQKLGVADIAVVTLVAMNNRFDTLRRLVPELLETLARIHPSPGEVVKAGQAGTTSDLRHGLRGVDRAGVWY